MKFPFAWTLCIILVVIIVVVLFSKGVTEKQILERQEFIKAKSIIECNTRRMVYAGIEFVNYDKWNAVCLTESPLKFYQFEVRP